MELVISKIKSINSRSGQRGAICMQKLGMCISGPREMKMSEQASRNTEIGEDQGLPIGECDELEEEYP